MKNGRGGGEGGEEGAEGEIENESVSFSPSGGVIQKSD